MRLPVLAAAAVSSMFAVAAWAQQDQSATLTATGNPDHGAYLIGPDGRPVYAFLSGEEVGGDGLDPLESCDESCRDNWNLVTVDGDVRVGDGLDPELASTREVDGETVVTYGDHPLFYFYRDVAGEPPEGQGIYSFGGYWALLTPYGNAIRTGSMPEVDQTPDVPDD